LNSNKPLDEERRHLAMLLEAIQRCVFFLDGSSRKVSWPLDADGISSRKQDIAFFESLAAINERFAKLQDSLGSAMRHAALLAGEPADSFLKVLAFYEKNDVIASIEQWQLYRAVRNLAAHDYETDYGVIADHFNSLHLLLPPLYIDAENFVRYCSDILHITPATADFDAAFYTITHAVHSGDDYQQRHETGKQTGLRQTGDQDE